MLSSGPGIYKGCKNHRDQEQSIEREGGLLTFPGLRRTEKVFFGKSLVDAKCFTSKRRSEIQLKSLTKLNQIVKENMCEIFVG